jgi:thiaminase/transcriptional activator TenA
VEHWTTPDFALYVNELERLADEALAEGRELEHAEAAFRRVAELEHEFWQMAWSGEAGGER